MKQLLRAVLVSGVFLTGCVSTTTFEQKQAELDAKNKQLAACETRAKSELSACETVRGALDAKLATANQELVVFRQAAEAKRVERQPLVVAPVVASVERPTLDRINLTERWGFRVVDAALIPREWLIPDLVKIGKVVRALKGETRIPGIVTYAESGVSAGAA